MAGAPLRLSFFVELPFDVGLPEDSTVTLLEGSDPIEGWGSASVAPLPGVPEMPTPGLWIGTSLWFRRRRVRSASTLEATDKAFGKVLRAAGRRPSWKWRFRRFLAPEGVRGREKRAVVQITRICAPPEQVDMAFVSDQFDRGLDKLNDYLVAAASVSRDWAIRPVSLRDLPMVVLYAMSELPDGPPEVSILLLHHHEQIEADDLTPAQAEHVANIVSRHHGPGHPFFSFGEAMVEARHALVRGRAVHGVLEMEIAFEVAIGAVMRELLPTREAAGILQAGFRNVMTTHLPRLVDVQVDLDDSDTPYGAWYQQTYLLRNRIVHEGYRPRLPEARSALTAAKAAIDDLAEALARNPATRELSRMLVTEPA